jgi:hypothetical protein
MVKVDQRLIFLQSIALIANSILLGIFHRKLNLVDRARLANVYAASITVLP